MSTTDTSQPPMTWSPSAEQIDEARLTDFMRWVETHRGVALSDYREVWSWSVSELSDFWDSVRQYFQIIGDGFDGPALADETMPGATWYPGATLNFAENVLRHANDPELVHVPAIVDIDEQDTRHDITWGQLAGRVGALSQQLRSLGVRPGDRVAAVLPNIPEAIIGLLAAASIGAVWTINSPDLSAQATLDRLAQLEPTVLIAADGYQFNGKDFERLEHLADVRAGLPSVKHTIVVNKLNLELSADDLGYEVLDFAGLTASPVDPEFLRVPFSHPLWILFSSGTTGAPKGIVHSHGGMALEASKGCGLNQDMGPGDLYYVVANTSWMVWNTLVNNLMVGASVVTYAGSPTYQRKDRQFHILAHTGATMFATGAAYLSLVQKAGVYPGQQWDLSRLRAILSTGSPLPESTWKWVHDEVKSDVHLGSDTGGTDICSGFIGSNPLEPVRLGYLQGPLLGVAVEARSEAGDPVINEVGDLVVTRPMPSMPVSFWGDADGSRYRSSYFDKFPGDWTQGDWITETDWGGFVVHGRSDATLNRQGVRLGSADIYNAVQHVQEVADSLVIGVEESDGGYYMPLFVVLKEGATLSEELITRIATTIRSHTSARHVPDTVLEAPAIPVTHAGKKIEVPIKRLFLGHRPEDVINASSLSNPEALDWFIRQARQPRD
ncbi:acetoacetate--CoA ligase [Citricoccus muralis]|uniref:Acetoacetate--CoA ligase n=1 Tax=Citricoccus muralis TaxID=169134 RepID=A0ABY8H462_9MICC|nr:acetoacetate--CoA ligase [Citricoccus muralis]WFP15923.1 acetoacetate--CoA ligase [Citricoccus muralis]